MFVEIAEKLKILEKILAWSYNDKKIKIETLEEK